MPRPLLGSNIVFELFDDELLLVDDCLNLITYRYQADQFLVVNYRYMAHAFVGH